MTEDLTLYFADFGVEAVAGDARARVLRWAPDSDIMAQRVQTTGHAITYITADFPDLAHGDLIAVEGEEFEVQTVSNIDDGATRVAELQRTQVQR